MHLSLQTQVESPGTWRISQVINIALYLHYTFQLGPLPDAGNTSCKLD